MLNIVQIISAFASFLLFLWNSVIFFFCKFFPCKEFLSKSHYVKDEKMFSANEKSHEEKKRQEKESAHRLCFIIKTTKFEKLGTFKRVRLRSRFRCSSWLISAVTQKSGINVCIKIYICTNITLDTQKLCKVIIISCLKSTLSDLNGFMLMFVWGLSSYVLISQSSGKRSLSAWNPLCLQLLFKFSLCSFHQMLSSTHIPYAKIYQVGGCFESRCPLFSGCNNTDLCRWA